MLLLIIFGKGAIKKMKITHKSFQLLNNAHDKRIKRNPDARNADKKIILFSGFIKDFRTLPTTSVETYHITIKQDYLYTVET